MQLVNASGNSGKLSEFRVMFECDDVEVRAQSDFDIVDIDETGQTFVENALLKARHAALISGLPALGDDSGLCVDALGGSPGLLSARYGGVHGDAARNIERLLRELDGVQTGQRTARFHCVLVLLHHAADPQPLIAEGSWEGRILTERRGDGGFGYDPVFLDLESGASAAEIAPSLKNRVSHRGRALAVMRQKLQARFVNM